MTTERRQDRPRRRDRAASADARAPDRDGEPARARPAPSGSRRRGALLRRLLATGDWVALIAALCVATAATSTTDVGDALLGGALQPGLDPGAEAARPLRQRPPADPPQHPRRAALADLGQRPRHARPRRPAGAEPGRAALGRRARSSSASAPCSAASSLRARAALRLAPADRGRHRHRRRPGRGGRRGRAAGRDPPGGAPAAGRLPLAPTATRPTATRAAAARLDRRHLPGRPRARRSSGWSSPSRR